MGNLSHSHSQYSILSLIKTQLRSPPPVAVSLDLLVVEVTMPPPALSVPRGMVLDGAMGTASGPMTSASSPPPRRSLEPPYQDQSLPPPSPSSSALVAV